MTEKQTYRELEKKVKELEKALSEHETPGRDGDGGGTGKRLPLNPAPKKHRTRRA